MDEDEGISQSWTSRFINILLCRGDLAHEKLEAQPVSIKQLFRYGSKKDKFKASIGVILAIIIGIMQAGTCIVTGYIGNLYLMNRNQIGNDELWWSVFNWCIVAGCLAIIMMIVSFLQSYFLLSACTQIINKIRHEFVKAVLRQNANWFESHDAGLISSQLNNNVERIQDGMADKIGLIIRGFSLFIFSSLFSFYINWRVTLATIAFGPLGAVTMGLMARCSAKPIRESLDATNDAAAIAEESVMNVKTVAACNGQESMIKKYTKILTKSLHKTITLSFVNGFFEGMMFLELYVCFTAGLFYGIVIYFKGEPDFEPGTIMMAANTVVMGGYFLSLLGPHMMAVLKARVAASVIYKTIDSSSESEEGSQNEFKLEDCKGELEFNNVHFKYPSRETTILKGCSWKAAPGDTIAFVGRSGCGKSTSISLLTRLYAPCSGTVSIDGVDIQKLNLRDLRKRIGVVQQEPCLFNGTIRENIVLGRDIPEHKVEEAARTANAHDFIMKLANGYDTILGVGGVSLSGGQKQRIAIVRAIVTNPKILLLDEATSALDSESERIVQKALNQASEGKTTVIIAHRLSTLKDVKHIHVIDNGVVVEKGSHQQLIAHKGLYAALAKAQDLDGKQKHSNDNKELIGKQELESEFLNGYERSSIRSSVGKLSFRKKVHPVQPVTQDKNDTKQKQKSASSIRNIYFSSEGRWITLTTLICCILRGLELPIFSYGQLFPFVALEQTEENFAPWLVISVLVFSLLGIYSLIFVTTAVGFGGWASEKTVNEIRVKVLRSLLHRDAAYFDEPGKSNAACVSTLSSNSPAVNACLDYRFMHFSNNLTSVVFCILFTYLNCWQTGLTSTTLILLFVVFMWFTTNKIESIMTEKDEMDKTAEFAIEIFEQARTIQLLGVEDYFTDRYLKQQQIGAHLENKLSIYQSLVFMMTLAYVLISDFFCFTVGSYMIYRGHVSAAHGVTAAFTANFAGWSVIFASPTFNDLVKAASAAKSLFALVETELSDTDSGSKPALEGSLKVENVNFAYPSRPDVIVARGLNLSAAKNESIALVGASGCGKSTVIQLLERFYTANSGQINLDNFNILELSKKHLRNNIALVGQEPVLFKGSIHDNIVLGCEGTVSRENVQRVAELANAAKFIEAFPLGYDTDVGEKGKALSGGQKQRIAIARALIRNPKLLLLDEATSALDTESEAKVQKALNEASTGRTTITIAHRLSTIKNADRIYFIEDGRVVEYGTHEELLALNGHYSRMVEAQALQKE